MNKLLFLGEKLSYNRDRASLITFPVRNWERDKRDKQDNEIFPSYCHQSPVTSHQSPVTFYKPPFNLFAFHSSK
ncbi:hypothetical protein [Sphaerospermopsis sp. FACHB-1194]|uniref:hypothetical protein n=1 Tax=Sphaerospermopsis sp. FACHB-1194 TaxID=2692862 RepID=UPI0016818D73|nr:hypothetical protein [Sphaerospermopsis sp. FACHB-1194]MBD2144596.1 hypothetical protein [Sphaerospermopsis sp. FACHB-1194]